MDSSAAETATTLCTLPRDVLVQLLQALRGHDVLSLGQCNGALREVAACEAIWSDKLQCDCGFTADGLELWSTSGRSLRQAWIDFVIKHEPLEAALLRDPQRVNGGVF